MPAILILIAWHSVASSFSPTIIPPPDGLSPPAAQPAESPPTVEPTTPVDPTVTVDTTAAIEPAATGEASPTVTPAATVEPRIEPVGQVDDDEVPAPSSTPIPSEPAPEGFRRPGHYLHVAPGLLALNVLDPKFRLYAWGLSGGRSLARGSRFGAQLGGFFEHLVGPRAPAIDLLRLGGEFRLGASTERVFAYALARTGLDVAVVPKEIYYGPGRRAALFFLLSLGAGLQGSFGPMRRLLLGVEPSFEFTWPGVLILFRTRAFLGWRFG